MNHAFLLGGWDVDWHHFKSDPECLKLNKTNMMLERPLSLYEHENHIRVICVEKREDTWINGNNTAILQNSL